MRIPTAETCIVNDAHGSQRDMCGRPAIRDRRFLAPACASHVCQHICSNGRRCERLPVRLDKGTIYPSGGWFPDFSRSANCSRHEKYNCVHITNDSVRCSGTKAPGLDYCASHAALVCRWETGRRKTCSKAAHPGSDYCTAHCCAVERPDGSRCPDKRGQTSIYCPAHQCAWKNLIQQQCGETWYPSTRGTCERHKCAHEGCDRRARDNTFHCDNHLCAFRFPRPEDAPDPNFPVCYRARADAGSLCALHAEYMELWKRVTEDRRAGGGYWQAPSAGTGN
ncbi:hypothetical protein VTK26DRAFT_1932 [Humicola hyalothermophila]